MDYIQESVQILKDAGFVVWERAVVRGDFFISYGEENKEGDGAPHKVVTFGHGSLCVFDEIPALDLSSFRMTDSVDGEPVYRFDKSNYRQVLDILIKALDENAERHFATLDREDDEIIAESIAKSTVFCEEMKPVEKRYRELKPEYEDAKGAYKRMVYKIGKHESIVEDHQSRKRKRDDEVVSKRKARKLNSSSTISHLPVAE